MKGFEKMLANTDIRTTAKENGVRFWEIAEHLKISEPTMTRKLRKELPDSEKQEIIKIIDELSAKKQASNA